MLTMQVQSNSTKQNVLKNNLLIDLQNITKSVDSDAGKLTILKGINLQVIAGEFVAIMGKSGSGKSTLLNIMTGIDRPTSGSAKFGDTELQKLSENELALWRSRQVGIIFQFFQLLPVLSALENVVMPMEFANIYSPRERYERGMSLLEQVGMGQHAKKLPGRLSGGEQQRVAIARALANDPPFLVADEPTGNLDTQTAEAVFDIFQVLVGQNKTIVMVTHDHELAQRAARQIVLSDGQIVKH
jgi:putative ABC transport system ATP-binding protein